MTQDALSDAIMNAPAGKTSVPFSTKLAYGFGAVAYGIKDNGFAVFLLIFYNQVMGMPAEMVGLAVLIALFADALFDPLVGYLSDRTRSRWGRRHPWLYAAILPIVLGWLIMWNPPEGLSGTSQFVFLIGMAMTVRFAFSSYEVPTLAMLPELTSDYDERTEILRYRFLFGWAGGLCMLYASYALILVPGPGYDDGLLNPDGYHLYGLIGGAVMIVTLLLSAIGTHRRIAGAVVPAAAEAKHEGLSALAETVRFRPFVILMLAGICAYANQGLVFALNNYLLLFVWEFSKSAFNIYPVALFVGVLTAFFLIGPVSKRFDKPKAAAITSALSAIIGTLPYWLRYFGLLPDNGSTALIPMILVLIALSICFGICAMILVSSMIADITDAAEIKTGRRNEGLFFAGFFFMTKCVGGLGILVSGLILAGVGFPDGAKPGSVDPGIVLNLVVIFAATTTVIGLLCAFIFLHVPLGRADHEARLSELAGKRARAHKANQI